MNRIMLLSSVMLLFTIACQPLIKESIISPAPNIRVLLAEVTNLDSVIFKGTYLLNSEEARYEFGPQNQNIFISPFKKGFKIFNSNRMFVFQSSIRISLTAQSSDAAFVFSNRMYSGDVIIQGSNDASVQIINKINLEEYLRGVVPGEIPCREQKYFDAMKAQAICARTYALGAMLHHKGRSFDIFPDERDQVYLGASAYTDLGDQAISLTRGDALMYNDSLAAIYYHSTCGGLLEDAGNVWPGSSRPYLAAGQDALGKDFSCAPSPYFRWTRQFSLHQIDSLFNKKYSKSYFNDPSPDTLQLAMQVRVLERTARGRVKKMQITYGDTSITLNGYSIRRFFTKSGENGLPSALFNISAKADSMLIIEGGGFGHGVGMCQWGALHMAELGFKYYDILVNKYFKGAYLKKVY